MNTLSLEAAKAMERLSQQNPKKLSEAEKIEWARARLAWIALKRLQGQEGEALQIFQGCQGFCEKYGPEKEWKSVRAWGCAKKREAIPCLSGSTKAKTQKPPQ